MRQGGHTSRDPRAFVDSVFDRIAIPRIRSQIDFATSEIILPDGPYRGSSFNPDRQPWSRLWFESLDSGHWRRRVLLGPTQSGKTLCGYVIPLLYHLFEIGETVILGLPVMDMAADKWREDIFPVIEASRYRDLMPLKGTGSRGGKFESIKFRHGPTLRFMSGGGGDEKRSGFTARVLCVTEVDKMDEAGGTSREADKISQLEARTDAYDDQAVIYLECTVSTETGRIWQEYTSGTESKIVRPCPHCKGWVTPEREQLVGWQGTETKEDAREKSEWSCPDCGECWSEDDRRKANLQSRLTHKGQEVTPEGEIVGDPPRTDTLGFRYSAIDNQFRKAGTLGAREWSAERTPDQDNSEKSLRQFQYALPHKPESIDVTNLDAHTIARRVTNHPRGVCPPGCRWLTVGVDLGLRLCHWVAVAWREGATGYIVDYGRLEVASESVGVDKGLLIALRDFRDRYLSSGWSMGESRLKPDVVGVDARWHKTPVYAFCRESGPDCYYPTMGYGALQQTGRYSRPRNVGGNVRWIGEDYHGSRVAKERITLIQINVDAWKTWMHQRLFVPNGSAGSVALFDALPQEHQRFSFHVTAETQSQEFVPDKGTVTVWRQGRAANHWGDALVIAATMAHRAGVRLIEAKEPAPSDQQTSYFAQQQRR